MWMAAQRESGPGAGITAIESIIQGGWAWPFE
jgi:hypothetical protein